MEIVTIFAFFTGLSLWNVPVIIRLLTRLNRATTKVLLIVDDKLTGSLSLIEAKLRDKSFQTEGGSLVTFDPAKSRRITHERAKRYLGMQAYVVDKHSGAVLAGAENQDVENVRKEAAKHVASHAMRELATADGFDLGPWVKYIAVVATILIVAALIGFVTYVVKNPGG